MSTDKQLLHFDQLYSIGDLFPGKTVKDFPGQLMAVGELHVRDDKGDVKVHKTIVTEFIPKSVRTAHGHINIDGELDMKVYNTKHPDRVNLPDVAYLSGEFSVKEDGTIVLFSGGNQKLVGYRLRAMMPVDPVEVVNEAQTELRRYFTPDQVNEALLNHFDKQYGTFKPEVRARVEEIRKILRP